MDTTSVTPEAVDEARRRELRKLRMDLGPLVLGALEDRLTIDVILNDDGRLWLNRFGEPKRSIGRMDPVQAESVLRTVASILRTTVTAESPCWRASCLAVSVSWASCRPWCAPPPSPSANPPGRSLASRSTRRPAS
jgi:Flp pilus assembly CpaF family ATPase